MCGPAGRSAPGGGPGQFGREEKGSRMSVLETERTILRPFQEADAEDLYRYARDPRVGSIAGWKPHESVEESRRIIQTVFASPNVFAVVDRESGHVIGSAGFVSRPQESGSSSDEIGYALDPAWWGRGLMPEVVEALVRYGFEELDLGAIWCSHYEENRRSRRVIEKCGFRYVFTEQISDEFQADRPTRFYVMLRPDWERRETACE